MDSVDPPLERMVIISGAAWVTGHWLEKIQIMEPKITLEKLLICVVTKRQLLKGPANIHSAFRN